MIRSLYSLYDKKTNYFNPPVCCHNEKEACRTFAMVVQGKASIFNQYPSDFDLYELGTFDDHSAKLESHETPKYVKNVSELIAGRNPRKGSDENENTEVDN